MVRNKEKDIAPTSNIITRQILFRGKRKDNKKWVEGYYYEHFYSPYIITYELLDNGYNNVFNEVIPESVGVVLSKIIDIQQNQIWEKSILQSKQGEVFIITTDDTETGFVLESVNTGKIHYFNEFVSEPVNGYKHFKVVNLKVIGNTFDNPELLELKEE